MLLCWWWRCCCVGCLLLAALLLLLTFRQCSGGGGGWYDTLRAVLKLVDRADVVYPLSVGDHGGCDDGRGGEEVKVEESRGEGEVKVGERVRSARLHGTLAKLKRKEHNYKRPTVEYRPEHRIALQCLSR